MTTTKLPGETPDQLDSQDATPSPKIKQRLAKKASRKPTHSRVVSAKRPATLEDARREMLRLVCINSAAITQAVIDDALQGKYLSAKFLFEAVGLCAMKGDDLEEATSRESLASILLPRFQMVVPEGMEVTEVVEVTPDMDAADEPPVESYEA